MRAIDMIKNRLTARQVYVMQELIKGDKTASDLAGDLLSTASMTQIIDKLEAMKLARRAHSKRDRRCWVISLTKKGKELLDG
jgi:DNA-binding MarR family transcriptional regulator